MQGYATHETFWADAKMYIAMLIRAIILGLILQIMLLGAIIYQTVNEEVYISGTTTLMPTSTWVKYHTGLTGIFATEASIEKPLLPYSNGWEKVKIETYRQFADYLTGGAYMQQRYYINKWFKRSFFCYLSSLLYLLVFWKTAKSLEDKKIIRGAEITPLSVLNRKLATVASKNSRSCLKIGETILPYEMEPKHMLVLGASGSGKGVLLNQLVMQINDRKYKQNTGEKAIFYDVKGEFVSKQNQPGDLIFNPFDSRSLGWNIFSEIEIPPDFDVMSRSLFSPPSANDDSYWYNCAGDVFRTGLVYLKMNGTTTNKDLWDFFSQPLESIKNAFKSLPIGEQGALKHIDKSDSPASASIISILQERIQFFRYLVDIDGDFSFRRFIRNQSQQIQPNLFILNVEQYATIFKPLMTMAIDTMARETLSLPDDLNRRIWFVVDELGTLNRMDSIIKLETVGRSKGACLVCANQDLGRVEEAYGRANLKSFFNNFNTTFTFRIREPESAEFLSRAIGEQQLIKTSQSRQMSPNEVGDRKSISEHEKTERLILPTEFQSLPDLTAIINIAGYGVSQITIPALFYKEQYPSFVMRDFAAMDKLASAGEVTAKTAEIPQGIDQISFSKLKV